MAKSATIIKDVPFGAKAKRVAPQNQPFKFTQASVRKAINGAPAGSVRFKDSELSGLVLRRQGNGSFHYYLHKRIAGRLYQIKIDALADNVRVVDVRTKATALIAQLQAGGGVSRSQMSDSAAGLSKLPVADLLEFYLKTTKLRPASLDLYRAALKNYGPVLPKTVAAITPERFRAAFTRLTGGGFTPATASRYAAAIRAMVEAWRYSFPPDQRPAFNPVAEGLKITSRKSLWAKHTPRTRRLSREQIPVWLDAIRTADPYPPLHARQAMEFLLLSGMRLQEVLGLYFHEIHDGWIILPPERVKNGKEFRRPITKGLQQIIDRCKATRKRGQQHLFAPPSTGKPMSALSWNFKRIGNATGIEITAHDLRRTFAGTAESVGVSGTILKALLGHTAGGDITLMHYSNDLSDFLPERAQAVEDAILSGVE